MNAEYVGRHRSDELVPLDAGQIATRLIVTVLVVALSGYAAVMTLIISAATR
jgi:hypothetical protein